jgi:hypothetical protein
VKGDSTEVVDAADVAEQRLGVVAVVWSWRCIPSLMVNGEG